MAQAYDFALDKIGMEIMSYQVGEASHSPTEEILPGARRPT